MHARLDVARDEQQGHADHAFGHAVEMAEAVGVVFLAVIAEQHQQYVLVLQQGGQAFDEALEARRQ
jgi:hypothetical protein